jgi:hypothetical protein
MRSLSVFCLPLLIAGLASGGQVGAPFSSQMNALGGHYGAAGMGRPLGGITASGGRGYGSRRGTVGTPYVYPSYGYSWYVPSAGYGFYDYSTPSSVAVYGAETSPFIGAPPPVGVNGPPIGLSGPPVAPSQPVIIHQYFNGPPPNMASQTPPIEGAAPAAGQPLAPVDSYYLIAYKDHSVYPVLSYWLEDKTLHYVTTQNTHNQASLDLIDLDLTRTLNKARNVPFSFPAQ